jgi:hypothetical protein
MITVRVTSRSPLLEVPDVYSFEVLPRIGERIFVTARKKAVAPDRVVRGGVDFRVVDIQHDPVVEGGRPSINIELFVEEA